MKKLVLLLCIISAGFTAQAQIDSWAQRSESYKELYHLATEIGKETDKVTALDRVVSIITTNGTISVKQERDTSKPESVEHYKYKLLTSAGKTIPLDLKNSEAVIESFYRKLLHVKEELRKNYDADVENILDGLFGGN